MRLADAEGGICGEDGRDLGDEGILEYTAANCGHHTGLWTDELNQSPRILVCAVRYCDLVKSGTAFHNPHLMPR